MLQGFRLLQYIGNERTHFKMNVETLAQSTWVVSTSVFRKLQTSRSHGKSDQILVFQHWVGTLLQFVCTSAIGLMNEVCTFL